MSVIFLYFLYISYILSNFTKKGSCKVCLTKQERRRMFRVYDGIRHYLIFVYCMCVCVYVMCARVTLYDATSRRARDQMFLILKNTYRTICACYVIFSVGRETPQRRRRQWLISNFYTIEKKIDSLSCLVPINPCSNLEPRILYFKYYTKRFNDFFYVALRQVSSKLSEILIRPSDFQWQCVRFLCDKAATLIPRTPLCL